ncbi:MAG: hypothetical protein ACOC8I_03200 [Desulfosalsimonas sp.]
MGNFITLVFLAFLAFVGFAIYFIFKILEFVMQAINLYKNIIEREDTIIKLLEEIRNSNNLSENRSINGATNDSSTKKKSTSPQKPANSKNSIPLRLPCEYCGSFWDFEDLDMYDAKYICPACKDK